MSRAPTEIAGRELTRERFLHEVVAGCQPVVLRGLINDWPAVRAARESPRAFMNYLAAFDAGAQIEVFFGDPAIAGKYYYGQGLQGFNFERRVMAFGDAMQAIIAALDGTRANPSTRDPRPAGSACRDSRPTTSCRC